MARAILTITCGAFLLAGLAQTTRAAGVVGTGTAASCTDAALDTALTGGGLVTFNCGGPTQIDVSTGSGVKTIRSDTTVDGGGIITISGGGRGGVFEVPFLASRVTFTVQNLTITSSGGYKSAVFNHNSTLNVANCTFSGNNSDAGGAIRSYGQLTVTNSIFSGNSVTGTSGGGAILHDYGRASVTHSTFVGNRAPDAGAIFNLGRLTVANCTFSDNSASRYGGGIANGGSAAITNSTFSGNRAGSNGGAIFNNYGSLTLTNSTLTSNSAGELGGGIFKIGTQSMTITNTILANSSCALRGYCDCANGVIYSDNNIDTGTTCGFTGAGCLDTNGTSLCNTNPALDPDGLQNLGGPTDTIALQPGSPAINAGDNDTCESGPVWGVDQRGYSRPGAGSTSCSIGAYEFDSIGLGPATPTNTPTLSPTPTPTLTPTLTPAVACVSAPRTGCQRPERSARILLNAASKTMAWKWSGNEAPIALSQFGDPIVGPTTYHLCAYDTAAGSPSLAFAATVPAGGTCGARPCWKQTRNYVSYLNDAATPDGVRRMKLRAGATGAYIEARGKGANLHFPRFTGVFLLYELPEVIVQVQRSDSPICWEAVFTRPPTKSRPWVFGDKTR